MGLLVSASLCDSDFDACGHRVGASALASDMASVRLVSECRRMSSWLLHSPSTLTAHLRTVGSLVFVHGGTLAARS